MQAKGILVRQGTIEMTSVPVRAIHEGEILIETAVSAISPGTELRCMRLSADGSGMDGYIPGYALVGKVLESKSPRIAAGTTVFCNGSKDTGALPAQWGGHVSHAIADASDVCVVPADVDETVASLSALAAISYHGYKRGKMAPGETVACIGLGAIGMFSALIHQHFGGDVVCADLSATRVELAREMGLNAVLVQGSLKETFAAAQPDGATLVVDSTGAPAVIAQAIELAAETPWNNAPQPEVRYLVQGSYADTFAVPYGTAFDKQLSFLLPRNRQQADVEDWLALAAENAFDAAKLISARLTPEEAPQGYAMLRDPESTPGTIVFSWQ